MSVPTPGRHCQVALAACRPDLRRRASRPRIRPCRTRPDHVIEGLRAAPMALIGLLQGPNLGKQRVRLGPGPGP